MSRKNKGSNMAVQRLLMNRLEPTWYGDQSALNAYTNTWLHLDAMDPMELSELRMHGTELLASQTSNEDHYADHYMIDTYADGRIGVISVAGGMMNHPLPLRAFGLNVTTYGEIQRAVTQLANDNNIEQIVMTYATGGGSGNGLFRTANLMERVAKIKPITTFTDTAMMSAGYWLGAIGSKIVAEPMAEVGSIGVYTILASQVEANREEGLDIRVVRAGEFKAMGHPDDPVTEKALQVTQASVDKAYDAFLDHASNHRGIKKETFREKAAEGRVFVGEDARVVGLVDEIMVFDDLLDRLEAGVGKVKPVHFSGAGQTRKTALNGDVSMNKRMRKLLAAAGITLDDAQLAALQSGASFSSIGLPEDLCVKLEAAAGEPDEGEGEGEGEGKGKPDADGEGEGEPDAGGEGEGKDKNLNAGGNQGNLMELVNKVTELSSNLATAKSELTTIKLEKSQLDTQLANLTNEMKLMKPILAERINAMNLGMRKGTTEGLADLPVDKLLEAYNSAKNSFEAAFPVGQKSHSANTKSVKGEGRLPDHWVESAKNATTI